MSVYMQDDDDQSPLLEAVSISSSPAVMKETREKRGKDAAAYSSLREVFVFQFLADADHDDSEKKEKPIMLSFFHVVFFKESRKRD